MRFSRLFLAFIQKLCLLSFLFSKIDKRGLEQKRLGVRKFKINKRRGTIIQYSRVVFKTVDEKAKSCALILLLTTTMWTFTFEAVSTITVFHFLIAEWEKFVFFSSPQLQSDEDKGPFIGLPVRFLRGFLTSHLLIWTHILTSQHLNSSLQCSHKLVKLNLSQY